MEMWKSDDDPWTAFAPALPPVDTAVRSTPLDHHTKPLLARKACLYGQGRVACRDARGDGTRKGVRRMARAGRRLKNRTGHKEVKVWACGADAPNQCANP